MEEALDIQDLTLEDLEAGGSGYVNIALLKNDSTVTYTSAGNSTFLSPTGSNETGHTGNGYARIMLNVMLDKAGELGFKEVTFTTKPSVMEIGYGLYKRMGFEEVSEKDDIVSMRMELEK